MGLVAEAAKGAEQLVVIQSDGNAQVRADRNGVPFRYLLGSGQQGGVGNQLRQFAIDHFLAIALAQWNLLMLENHPGSALVHMLQHPILFPESGHEGDIHAEMPTNDRQNTVDSIQFNGKSENSARSEEHTSELQSLTNLVCRLLLEKKKDNTHALTVELLMLIC